MRIAIMQPYFIPYAGYFRLFASVDLFVVYDCVQFPRRGFVHRNKLPNFMGEMSWITLPLAKATQDIKISSLSFAKDADLYMKQQFNRFPLFSSDSYLNSEFSQILLDFTTSPITYITKILNSIIRLLDIQCHVVRSSDLVLPDDLKGQDRIITISQHFKAKTYINAPGGKSLYDESTFKKHGLELRFLSDYQGPKQSILARLLTENLSHVKKEIVTQSLEC